jgi:hypothetical protein
MAARRSRRAAAVAGFFDFDKDRRAGVGLDLGMRIDPE